MKPDLQQACQHTSQIVAKDRIKAEEDTAEEDTVEVETVEVETVEMDTREVEIVEVNIGEIEAKEVSTDAHALEDANSKEPDSDKTEAGHRRAVGVQNAGLADIHSHIPMVYVQRQTRNALNARRLGILPECARALTQQQHR